MRNPAFMSGVVVSWSGCLQRFSPPSGASLVYILGRMSLEDDQEKRERGASRRGEAGRPAKEPRRHPRTELSLLVQYRFDSVEAFLAEYALNISPGGMFIKTTKRHERGAIVFFQFSLRDGSRLIEGMGRVVHVTPPGSRGREPGIGVEFLHFDEGSGDLVASICESRLPMKN